ncbi:MAG TPA: class I adenylate-forming enzyme family protein [Pseudonocardiaceae bacterium]|nr:class I adenylate-forming enzyme family protein [Pseudonocardiaceae bacterium]
MTATDRGNLGGLLADLARRRGDTMAIGSPEGVVTYRELYAQARRVCGALRTAGVLPGDRVALLGPNSPRYIAAIFGTFLAGAVSVGVSTWYTPEQIGYVLGHAEPKALFTVPDFLGRDYIAEVKELPVTPVVYDLDDWAAIDTAAEVDATLAPPDSAAYLLYTSGSTGPPKGVLLRHDGLIRNSTEAAAKLGIGPDDVAYVGVPLCFAYGCVQGLLTSFVHGAGVVIQRRFEPAEGLALVERFGCTTWFGVPSMVRRTVAVPGFRTDRLATVTKGRVGHAPDDIRFARERFGMANVCVGYGMTELYGPCALSDREDDLDSRIEGWCDVLPSTDIRIVDPDTEQEVPPGEPGEIRAKSVFGYLAYYRDPERNAAQFDAHGYFRTGDQGVRRADGRLRFTGRYKNLIKTNGLNIAAEDIERGMVAHPAVTEACAFGIPHRTKEEAPVVVVVTDGTADAESLLAWRESAFLSFEAPAVVVAAGVLPKMSEQKIDRLRVAADCRAWLDQQDDLTAFLDGTRILAWDGVRDDD